MLKELPEDILMNISSFLLGTPQQLKMKHSNTFKQTQKKLKFDEKKLTDKNEIRQGYYFSDEDPEDNYKIERYGYVIRDKNYSIEKALRIMKGQCDRLLNMSRPYGLTNLNIYFNFRVLIVDDDEDDDDILLLRIDDLDYLDTVDVLDKMNEWIRNWSGTLNDFIKFESIHFLFKNKSIHYDD